MIRAFLPAAALLVAGCSAGKPERANGFGSGLKLDDGACGTWPGAPAAASPADVTAVASDGARIFTVDGPSGDLRSQPLVGGTAVVLARGYLQHRWERDKGQLAADDRYVYWLAKASPLSGTVPPRLMRIPKNGGAAQAGFAPSSARELIAGQDDLLLLGDDGLWQLDRQRWGEARLIARGAFAHVAADHRRAFLLASRDPIPEPDVGPSLRIVAVDRTNGTVAPFFESSDLAALGSLRADDTHVYLTALGGRSASEPSPAFCRRRPMLLRLAKQGGAVERIPVPCPAGEDLAVSGEDVFWLDGSARRVLRAPRAGGRVSIAGPLTCAGVDNRLLAEGARFFAWNADGSCPLQTGTRDGTNARVIALVDDMRDLLAATGTSAFITVGQRVRRISLADAAIEDLKYEDGRAVTASEGVVTSGDDFVFIDHDAAIEKPFGRRPVGHFVGRWSARSSRASKIFEGLARMPVASGADVYFVSGHSVLRLAGLGGAAATVIKDAGDVQSLAVSRRRLFWSVVANPDDKTGRTLWSAGLDGSGPVSLAIDWLDLVAADSNSDEEAPYYSTFGRSTSLVDPREKVPGQVVRSGRWGSRRVADNQDGISNLVVTPLGVAWWQKAGMRWLPREGRPQAVDGCAGKGSGLAVVGRRVVWADRYAGALMETSLPP